MRYRPLVFAALGFLVSNLAGGSPVRWFWAGGVEADRAVITALIEGEGEPRLLLATADGRRLPDLRPSASANDPSGGRVWRFEPGGLPADASFAYTFADSQGRRLDEEARRFVTMPRPGAPASFRFAVSSCSRDTDSPVFDAVRAQGARFFLHVGDFHYADIARNEVSLFRAAFAEHLVAPRMRALMAAMPVLYQWDDHDFGPDNSNRMSPSRAASLRNFREMVPHYPLPVVDADTARVGPPTDQAFTVGRVRFILSDLRSRKDPQGRRMMSAEQDAWLRAELLAAKGKYPLIFWVSGVPWNGEPTRGDAWQGYAAHREELANFIRDNAITGLCVLAGDSHMTAIDDGTNADFSTGGGSPTIRILQAGPIAQRGSYKGGPYSHGGRADTPEGGRLYQFALVDVEDDGAEIRVKFSGREGSDGVGDQVLRAQRWGRGPIEHSFTVGP